MRLAGGRWIEGVVPPLLGLAAALHMADCVRHRPGGPPAELAPIAAVPDLDAPERCGAHAIEALTRCVEPGRLRTDVVEIARARPPGSAHHQAVRSLCRDRLEALGLDVTEQRYGTGVNVVGLKRGFSKSGQLVVLSAHYDHLEGCAGADDNASGVAALLEAARVLAPARFDRSLVVACWDGGEAGQQGSAAFARRSRARGDDIVLALVLEAIGFADQARDSQRLPERFEERFPDQALALIDNDHRADFALVVADQPAMIWAQAVVRHAAALPLPVHVLRLTRAMKADLDPDHRADQASFWAEGYPALLVSDTGGYRNPHIHCREGADTPDTLDYGFATRVLQAALGAAVEALELRHDAAAGG